MTLAGDGLVLLVAGLILLFIALRVFFNRKKNTLLKQAITPENIQVIPQPVPVEDDEGAMIAAAAVAVQQYRTQS